MKIKKNIIIFIMIITLFTFLGCNNKKDNSNILQVEVVKSKLELKEDEQIQDISKDEEVIKDNVKEEVNHNGQKKSILTGIWMDEELVNKRPYAIMLNNIKAASPQSGISEASILYEILVEGGITRLMGIFEQLTSNDVDRIGSVRSARHYFVSFADVYDAIFVHYGETKYATSKIKSIGINNLSGLSSLESTIFYRDNSISSPNNAFASASGILKATEIKGYRTEYRENFNKIFEFYKKDKDLKDGKDVYKIQLGFSSYTTPYFVYDKKSKLYNRFQYGVEHTDANTKNQLQFKNIIVQFVSEWNIDKNGYQTMDIENSSGEGLYLTNGKLINITWDKNEATKSMNFYNQDKEKLKLNSGKIYIAVFPSSRKDNIIIEEEK